MWTHVNDVDWVLFFFFYRYHDCLCALFCVEVHVFISAFLFKKTVLSDLESSNAQNRFKLEWSVDEKKHKQQK